MITDIPTPTGVVTELGGEAVISVTMSNVIGDQPLTISFKEGDTLFEDNVDQGSVKDGVQIATLTIKGSKVVK